MKILLVEDNEDDVVFFQDVLDHASMEKEVLIAVNGEKGLEMMRKLQPDLVILDINMPMMDGFEVLQEMKSDPDLIGIPVIMVSGSHREEERQRSYEAGAGYYLTKPLDFGKIQEAIRALPLRGC